jgi:hypothetical protein
MGTPSVVHFLQQGNPHFELAPSLVRTTDVAELQCVRHKMRAQQKALDLLRNGRRPRIGKRKSA